MIEAIQRIFKSSDKKGKSTMEVGMDLAVFNSDAIAKIYNTINKA